MTTSAHNKDDDVAEDEQATDELTDHAWMIHDSMGRTARKIRQLRERAEPDQWPDLEQVLTQGVAGLVRAME